MIAQLLLFGSLLLVVAGINSGDDKTLMRKSAVQSLEIHANGDITADKQMGADGQVGHHHGECTEADVFGDNATLWPTTFSQAKSDMVQVCEESGYPKSLCTDVIAEHWIKSAVPDEGVFSMSQKFCEESVELLKLDAIAHTPETSSSSYRLPQSLNGSMHGSAKEGGSRWYGHSVGAMACFPSDAAVSVRLSDGTVVTRSMEKLHVGDSVLTHSGYSKIFAFMDHVSDADFEYVHLQTLSGFELSLSGDHIVFAHPDQIPVLAKSITKKDTLWTFATPYADFVPSHVVSVATTRERGKHAPLTEQGTVVVNGVLSSSYAGVNSVRWGQRVLMSGHDAAKYIHEPLRLACDLMPSLCSPEWHPVEGRHVWTQLIIDKLGWLQAMNQAHSDIQAACLGQPSFPSWLAAFTQLIVVAAFSIIFGCGTTHKITLCAATIAVSVSLRKRL